MALVLFLLLIGIKESSATYDSQMQDLLEEFRNLKEVYVELKQENNEMKEVVVGLKKENDELKQANVEIQRRLNGVETDLQTRCINEQILPDLKDKRLLTPSAPDTQSPTVAFSAVLTKDFQIGPHQVIEYDKVLTNFGSAYDTRHGHFTAPVHGIYLISATSMSDSATGVRTEIVRNGVQMAAMYGDDYDIASHTIILELDSNDMVWVRNMDATNSIVHSGSDRYYSSFTGMLIKSLP